MSFVGEIFRVALVKSEGLSLGTVVNLYRDQCMNLVISALLLDPGIRVSEGSKVYSIGRLASLVMGDFAIGSLLDPVGNFILNSSAIEAQYLWLVESSGTGIIDRESVFEPLETGVISIDSIVPLGRGQRELIVGDRQTGKTSIGVDTILNQKYEKVFCIYLPLGA
jgi:F-type H+-transporting ATPase subunit alpha